MAQKLTIEELKKKKEYHKKRIKYYQKKIEEREKENKRIGFKWYD